MPKGVVKCRGASTLHQMQDIVDITVSRLAQLVERVTSNDEVSRSSRLMGIIF